MSVLIDVVLVYGCCLLVLLDGCLQLVSVVMVSELLVMVEESRRLLCFMLCHAAELWLKK